MTYLPGSALPPAASDRVEFISQIHPNTSTELAPAGTRAIDVGYLRRYVHALEDAGFDYTLLPYGSAGAGSFLLASAVGQLSDVIRPIVAARPNTAFPLVAAQQLATLDQLTQGRAIVHLISGGSDAEQARQGDYLPKDQRYARTAEFMALAAVHQAGLLAATVGARYGGPGLGEDAVVAILKAVGEGDASVALLVANTLHAHSGQAQRAFWPAPTTTTSCAACTTDPPW